MVVGLSVGEFVGICEGDSVGWIVVGFKDGERVGIFEGERVGLDVDGDTVG